jgi:predicted RNA binding protein YcfA (HicA-like mRNA interferase family)
MSKLLNQRRAIWLLEQAGWQQGKGGKHVVKMVKPGRRPLTLPRHRGQDYGKGLTQAILKQAGLEPKEAAWSSRSAYRKTQRDTGQRSRSSQDASRQAER